MWTGSAWGSGRETSGTQKLDGFLPASDAKLAAGPFNTAGSDWTAANMEQHLHERVSCFQFAHWLSGSDLLQVFGALRSAELSGGASWATLALFLVLVLFELGSLHVVGGNQSRCVCKLITGVVAVDLLNLLVCFDLLP